MDGMTLLRVLGEVDEEIIIDADKGKSKVFVYDYRRQLLNAAAIVAGIVGVSSIVPYMHRLIRSPGDITDIPTISHEESMREPDIAAYHTEEPAKTDGRGEGNEAEAKAGMDETVGEFIPPQLELAYYTGTVSAQESQIVDVQTMPSNPEIPPETDEMQMAVQNFSVKEDVLPSAENAAVGNERVEDYPINPPQTIQTEPDPVQTESVIPEPINQQDTLPNVPNETVGQTELMAAAAAITHIPHIDRNFTYVAGGYGGTTGVEVTDHSDIETLCDLIESIDVTPRAIAPYNSTEFATTGQFIFMLGDKECSMLGDEIDCYGAFRMVDENDYYRIKSMIEGIIQKYSE